MTLRMWQLLSIKEANETILEMVEKKDFFDQVSFNTYENYQHLYTQAEEAVKKEAADLSFAGSIYSEELAEELIIEFFKTHTEEFIHWLLNGLTYKIFKFNAGRNIGFIIDETGNRTETNLVSLRISKDVNCRGNLGFFVDSVTPSVQ